VAGGVGELLQVVVAKRRLKVRLFEHVHAGERVGAGALGQPSRPTDRALGRRPQIQTAQPLLRGNAHDAMVRRRRAGVNRSRGAGLFWFSFGLVWSRSFQRTGVTRRPRSQPPSSMRTTAPGWSADTPAGVPV